MPHVGDGEIAAYLDGALDLFPPAEAERIREHLRSCPDCGRRLAEEKALRDGAEAILGAAGPELGEAPPFEEIRARAAAPRSAPRGRRVPPTLIPWAASIVLALAVGWGTRGAVYSRTGDAPDLGVRSALEVAGGREADAEPVSTEVLDAVAETAPDAVSSDLTPEGAIVAEADAVTGDAFRSADAPAGEGVGQAQNAPAPQLSSPRSDDVSAFAEAAAKATEGESPAEEPSPEAAAFADRRGPAREAEGPADVQARRSLAESPSAGAGGLGRVNEVDERLAGQAAEGEELRARGSAPESSAVSPAGLMVPALQVESIAVDPALGPGGGLRIVQRLPGGERLEFLFVSGTAEAQEGDALSTRLAEGERLAVPAAPEGWSRIDLPRSGGWLVAQSAIPMDSLAALIAHLR